MPILPQSPHDPDALAPPAVVAAVRPTEDGAPPDEEEAMPPTPAPIPALAPAAPSEVSYLPATLQTSAPRGNAMAWLAGLSGVPPWVLVFLALTPWGQRMMGMEHEEPAQARAAIVAEVRREMGAELKAGLDGLRAELARDREAHEREHALEGKGVERELAAMREEMRLMRESLQPRRR